MCIHFVASRTSTTADFNVLSDGSKKFVVITLTFLHMIVVALSSVCNYGMAQDPALGLTVTISIFNDKWHHRWFSWSYPSNVPSLKTNDLLSCNQLTRVVFLGCVQQSHLLINVCSLAVAKSRTVQESNLLVFLRTWQFMRICTITQQQSMCANASRGNHLHRLC